MSAHTRRTGHNSAPRAGGKSKMSAAEANAKAKARISNKAQKKFGF